MKRTSHITKKNYPRRKPIMGLTPDDVVRQMTEEAKHGKGVRKVRREPVREKKPVLPDARKGSVDSDGEKRLPSAAPRDDAGRAGAGRDEEVSDDKRGTQLSRILKRMLGETPPAELLDTEDVGRVATNADALAAVIMREALGGRQWAIELVRDQTEGKPVRAAQMNNNEGEIEDMLDRVSQARLNQIAKGN